MAIMSIVWVGCEEKKFHGCIVQEDNGMVMIISNSFYFYAESHDQVTITNIDCDSYTE